MSAHHSKFLGQNLPCSVRTPRRGAPGFSRSRSCTKLPDASGSGQLPPSWSSPRVIVLAPHVDGLVHVALGGRLLAWALHRGECGAGRSPASATDAERVAAPSLPAYLLPPSLPPRTQAGAAPAAARSASRGSFPRCSPALPQEQAPATPPGRAGPPRPPTARRPSPSQRAPPLGVGVARDWLRRRGVVTLALT